MERKNAARRQPLIGHDLQHVLVAHGTSGNAGLHYEHSERLQSETTKRLKTAGPMPRSWWSHKVASNSRPLQPKKTMTEAAQSNLYAASMPFQPQTLKEECLCNIIRDLATSGIYLDGVSFLPLHLKMALLTVAARGAMLSDHIVEALLLDGGEHSVSPEPLDSWEEAGVGSGALPPERDISTLDLSHSQVTLSMLRRLLLINPYSQPRGDIPRLPRLRSLNLSKGSVPLSSLFVSSLFSMPLTSLVISGCQCTLFSPLEALSDALPTLQHLDISDSDWLNWDDFEKVDWAIKWRELDKLDVSNCAQLFPQVSYMNPEARAGGPPVIMEVMSVVRRRGRVRWLQVTA